MRVVRPARSRSTVAVGLVVGALAAAAAVALPAAASTDAPSPTRHAAAAARVRPAATTGTTTGGKVTCSWAPSSVSGRTATSLSFRMPNSSICIYPGPSSATIDVYASEADASARTNKVGSTVASWSSEGTVSGLSPDTAYWWVGSDHSTWVRGPERTLSATASTSCTLAPTQLHTIGRTSLSFLRTLPSGCSVTGTVRVDVYARKTDAAARTNVAGSASGAVGTVLTVDGLKSGKKYWYVTSDSVTVQGPVTTLRSSNTRTTTPPTCTADYRLVSAWGGGFVAEVTVTAGATAIGGWSLSWIYTGGQSVVTPWGAVVEQRPLGVSTTWAEGSSTSRQPTTDTTRTTTIATVSLHTTGPTSTSRPPTTGPTSWLSGVQATNLPGSGALAAGQSFRFGILGGLPEGMSASVPALTCTATRS